MYHDHKMVERRSFGQNELTFANIFQYLRLHPPQRGGGVESSTRKRSCLAPDHWQGPWPVA